MKLHFDSNQEYQLEAIKSITDIFEGQPLTGGDFEFSIHQAGALYSENGFGNRLALSQQQIWENVKTVQTINEIKNDKEALEGMNFSIEMETGTGKTYVYLRTIFELNKLYGFKKFVIVVPSVAIREGVLKNLQITQEHFQTLYDKVPVNPEIYDSKKVSNLRGFASGNAIQILVINIDSFAKDENIINKPNDKLTGKKPIEFIQSTNPIVIVDEPQNMETEIRKRLTRSTILEIIKKSGRISEVLINPQLFMDNVVVAIKQELYDLMIEGIKYEKIGGKFYEMKLFEDNELEIYVDKFTHSVTDPDKTIYENLIPLQSDVESQFAKDCESSENVEFYFKLPFWFKINTPIGSYNPDWAVAFKDETKLYFVSETKSDCQELRGSEKMKIKCGKEHFKEFKDIIYKRVSSVSELSK